MAAIPTKMASLTTIQASKEGSSFNRIGIVTDLDGAPIDLSAWFDIRVMPFNASVGPGQHTEYGTSVGNADGTVDVTALQADALGYNLGSYQYFLQGKPLTGDPYQTLGKGSLTFIEGAGSS